ncbi:Hypothetical protein, putative [Bodo saltans]|uniref:Uncharacterized protein n=1 Tax=Bodo saltans TaxID=75058 RepID=A0A0S4JM79_BODSA|nr:Hypothetical protein, putative [Bodo saltans]|eukprot:CUG90209.1 Hypothetical protein, putative [Bodo saltans]
MLLECSERLPSQFLLIARSGRCNDHAIPVISGRFGKSNLDKCKIADAQVIARRLGRVSVFPHNSYSLRVLDAATITLSRLSLVDLDSRWTCSRSIGCAK